MGTPISSKNFREKSCVLCGMTFKPDCPQRRACVPCSSAPCHKCGGPVSSKIKRRSRYSPTCLTCYKVKDGTRRVGSIDGKGRSGYVNVKRGSGWVLEHRLVMEGILGRKLLTHEIVHHIDGDKLNNDPSNLVLCSSVREHLDTFHKDDLKPPPVHRNGRRPGKWTDKTRKIAAEDAE